MLTLAVVWQSLIGYKICCFTLKLDFVRLYDLQQGTQQYAIIPALTSEEDGRRVMIYDNVNDKAPRGNICVTHGFYEFSTPHLSC